MLIMACLGVSAHHTSVCFFALPVPLGFFGEGKDSLLVFDNTFNGQLFHTNQGFMIDSVHFDPDRPIISVGNMLIYETVGICQVLASSHPG